MAKLLKTTPTSLTYKISNSELTNLLKRKAFIKSDKPYTLYVLKENNLTYTIYTSLKLVITGDIKKSSLTTNDKDLETKNIKTLGTDEVGTGDVFGGIVVAGALVEKNDEKKLIALGVKDSKMLTDEKIFDIAPKINKYAKIIYHYLSPDKYNKKHKLFNLNELKALMHNKIIDRIGKDADKIAIDAFCTKEKYQEYLKDSASFWEKTTLLEKGESKEISIACASVYARYIFLLEFKKLENSLNTTLPKGASTLTTDMVKHLLEKNIDIKKYCKTHFKNVTEISIGKENK